MVTETDNNRRWLIASRLEEQESQSLALTEEHSTALLYYMAQLEAELAHVRRQLAQLGSATHR